MSELDSTQNFPTYADLTQTVGWAPKPQRIHADTNDVAEAVETAGGLLITPHMHEIPRAPSLVLLLFASLAMTTMPCLFIGRIRNALNAAQRQILLQAWQFRRFGEDLIR